jgi:acetyl-CoA carboxylase carboxyl transferase alpha subunit
MQLAAKFRVPVVTFIDTPGAQATFESERRGIASALASLALMSNLPTPIISVIIGEGGSGGAIALAADRVLMMEHSIYSVISPEGAASILYRDVARAESMSEHLKLTAIDLLRLGIIDKLIPEPKGGAHLDPGGAAAVLRLHITAALQELIHLPERELFAKRYEKLRNLGKGGVYWREEIRSAITGVVRGFLSRRKPKARAG